MCRRFTFSNRIHRAGSVKDCHHAAKRSEIEVEAYHSCVFTLSRARSSCNGLEPGMARCMIFATRQVAHHSTGATRTPQESRQTIHHPKCGYYTVHLASESGQAILLEDCPEPLPRSLNLDWPTSRIKAASPRHWTPQSGLFALPGSGAQPRTRLPLQPERRPPPQSLPRWQACSPACWQPPYRSA